MSELSLQAGRPVLYQDVDDTTSASVEVTKDGVPVDLSGSVWTDPDGLMAVDTTDAVNGRLGLSCGAQTGNKDWRLVADGNTTWLKGLLVVGSTRHVGAGDGTIRVAVEDATVAVSVVSTVHDHDAAYERTRSYTKEGSSYYYEPAGIDGNSMFAESMNNGIAFIAPFDLDREVTIDRIAIEVTTVGSTGAVVRLGLYAADADGFPSSLIVDGGTVATDGTTGVKEVTVSATAGPGRIFIAAVGQGAPTTQAQTRQHRAVVSGIASSSVLTVGGRSSFQKTGVTGALPDPLGAPSANPSNDRTPRLHVRVA